MSIARDKDPNYRRSRAALAVAVLFLAAALLVVLEHQVHWPIAVHGFVVIVLFGVAMLLFFVVRGRGSRPDTRKSEESTHGN